MGEINLGYLKERSYIEICVNKPQSRRLINELPKFENSQWKYIGPDLTFLYNGTDFPKAEAHIPIHEDSWRKGYVEVVIKHSLGSGDDQFRIVSARRRDLLCSFYIAILKPYTEKNPDVKVIMDDITHNMLNNE